MIVGRQLQGRSSYLVTSLPVRVQMEIYFLKKKIIIIIKG
jgi:hypothetical protein